MTRGFRTLLMFTCLLLVFGSIADAQQPGPNQLPTFAAQVSKASKNPTSGLWDVTLGGSFAKVSGPMYIKFKVRAIDDKKSVIATTNARDIVEGFATPMQQKGIVRPPATPDAGTFTGYINLNTYTPDALTYQMNIEFWSGQTRISVYKENDTDWIPVPVP